MRRIDYFLNMIKAIYNNTKVNLQNNDQEITIIIGESGITDKCKFKDKSSTAHYYTRVLDLLAQSFLGKHIVFQFGNSKKTDVFSREKAVNNAFQYLLDLGLSKTEYMKLGLCDQDKNHFVYTVFNYFVLPAIFWSNLPESDDVSLANDEIKPNFDNMIIQMELWLIKSSINISSGFSLLSREFIIDTEFGSICGTEPTECNFEKCNYAVPMKLTDLLDIVPYFPPLFTLPSKIIGEQIKDGESLYDRLRKGYFPFDSENQSLKTSSSLFYNDDVLNCINHEYPLINNSIPLDILTDEVLYLTNLNDEILDSRYPNTQSQSDLFELLLKKAKANCKIQKRHYYIKKSECSQRRFVCSLIRRAFSSSLPPESTSSSTPKKREPSP